MSKKIRMRASALIFCLILTACALTSCIFFGDGSDTVILTDPATEAPETTAPETTAPETTAKSETTAEATTEEVTDAAPETTAQETTSAPETTSEPETTPEPEVTETPWNLVLVNPWYPLPEDYTFELATVSGKYKMDSRCADALKKMLADCKAAGHTPYICSAYRTWDDQTYLFNKKVDSYISKGYSEENARKKAATETAVPGTSEHQLGLAVDILCTTRPWLDDGQANTETQKWLMANCHSYGFILRYPKGTTDITGIIYEPWHYRYVGVEIATEIMTGGITLEEYLGRIGAPETDDQTSEQTLNG